MAFPRRVVHSTISSKSRLPAIPLQELQTTIELQQYYHVQCQGQSDRQSNHAYPIVPCCWYRQPYHLLFSGVALSTALKGYMTSQGQTNRDSYPQALGVDEN
jgi:hypothetical protein